MQFKLLTAAALLTVISAQAADPSACLTKQNCKADDKACIGNCFEIAKLADDQKEKFSKCGQDTCISLASDMTKFNPCLVECYNKVKGGEKKEGDKPKEEEKKEGDKPKEEEKKEGDKPKEEEKKEGDKPKEEEKKEGDKPKEEEKKEGDKPKEGEKKEGDKPKDTANKPSNASKVVPSVFAGFVLAALAL